MVDAKLWFWLVISTCPVVEVATGWLPPWWPNGSLNVVAAERPAEQLVAEADAEDRAPCRAGSPDRRRRRTATSAGSPGPLDRKTPSGSQGEDVGRRRRRRHDLDRAEPGEVAQDRALDAEVVGDDRGGAARRRPCTARRGDLRRRGRCRRCPARRAAAARSVGLGRPVPNAPGIAPVSRIRRVSRRVSIPAMPGDAVAHAASRRGRPRRGGCWPAGQLADDDAPAERPRGLEVGGVDAVVADVRVGERDDLAGVATGR